MRVILDTNVIVAALRSRHGASAELLRRLAAREYSIAISAALVFECEEVTVRELVPVFASRDDVDQVLRLICAVGEKYDPTAETRPLSPDPDDDFLVELVVAARVQYVVTHNTRHLADVDLYGAAAITPAEFLKMLREKP